MAERVAEWPERYGIDGIDLDLEDGAGDTPKGKKKHALKKYDQFTLQILAAFGEVSDQIFHEIFVTK